MRYWLGITDNDWFRFLAARRPDEVNFWQPSGTAPFTTLPPGTPFLFKLKAPHHHVGGVGFFVRFVTMPAPLAWDTFGADNGAATYREMLDRVGRLRQDGRRPHELGCSIVTQPVFWPEEEWIPLHGRVSNQGVVVGKILDTAEALGGLIWDEVQQRLDRDRPLQLTLGGPRFAEPVLVRPRLGQGAFRALVTQAYGRRCAITGENTLPVLEAAHIRPYAEQGEHSIRNGLLLRSDFHKLFDLGLVTVTPERRILVSARIREQYFNGKAYYRLHGERLQSLPNATDEQPDPDLLRWHNEHRFEQAA